jgi:hypothetical protein
MNADRSDKRIREQVQKLEEHPEGIVFQQAEAWSKLEQRLHAPEKKSFAALKWAVAACFIAVLFCSGYFIWHRDTQDELKYASKKRNDSNTHNAIQHAAVEDHMIAATTHHLQPELYETYSRKPVKKKKTTVQARTREDKKKNTAGLTAYADNKTYACYLSGSEFNEPCYYP